MNPSWYKVFGLGVRYFLAGFLYLPACQDGLAVSEIRFEGLGVTKTHVVTRELYHKPAVNLNCAQLIKEKRTLESLDVFAKVDIEVFPSSNSVKLLYKFSELPSYLVIPSIKQTDQFGWMLGPGFVAFNLFGEDLRAEAFLRSSLDLEAQQYLLSISSPWLAKYRIDYGFDFIRGLSQDNQRGYFDNSYRSNLYFYLPVYGLVEVYGDVGFAAIEVQDSMLNIDPLFFSAPQGWDYSEWLGGGLRLDGRNSKMYTSQGYMLEFGIKQFGLMGGNYSGREYSSEISLWNDWGWFQIHAMNFLRLREGRFSGTESYVLGGANSVRFMHPSEGVIAKSEVFNNFELERVLLHKRPTSFFDVAGYVGLSAVIGGEYIFYERFLTSAWVARKGGYLGLHVWVPGVEKFRLELGTEWSKVDIVFSLGMFQKRQTQRWRTR